MTKLKTIDDKYTITGFLGSGTFGEVFSAHDTINDREVAIKIDRSNSENAHLTRFFREARVLNAIDHPGILKTHGFGFHESRPYIVMDLLKGETLQELINSKRINASLIDKFVNEVGEAMQYAHDRKLVHRDLKPQNVMLAVDNNGQSRFVVLDFGIASKLDAMDSLVNQSFDGAGTPLFMPPEQVARKTPSPKMDIYAFGGILYLLVTGQKHLDFDSKRASTGYLESVMDAIRSVNPKRPSLVCPNANISQKMDTLLLRCLAKKPEERPATIKEVRYEFLAAREQTYHSAPTTMVSKSSQPNNKAAALVGAGLAVSVLALAGLLGWLVYTSQYNSKENNTNNVRSETRTETGAIAIADEELKEELKLAKDQVEIKSQQAAERQSQIVKLQSELSGLKSKKDSEIEKLASEVEAANQAKSQLQKQLDANLKQIESAQATIAQAKIDFNQLQKELATKSTDFEKLSEDLERKQESLDRLESQSGNTSKKYLAMQADLERAEKNYLSAQRAQQEAERKLKSANFDLVNEKNKIAQIEKQNQRLSLNLKEAMAKETKFRTQTNKVAKLERALSSPRIVSTSTRSGPCADRNCSDRGEVVFMSCEISGETGKGSVFVAVYATHAKDSSLHTNTSDSFPFSSDESNIFMLGPSENGKRQVAAGKYVSLNGERNIFEIYWHKNFMNPCRERINFHFEILKDHTELRKPSHLRRSLDKSSARQVARAQFTVN